MLPYYCVHLEIQCFNNALNLPGPLRDLPRRAGSSCVDLPPLGPCEVSTVGTERSGPTLCAYVTLWDGAVKVVFIGSLWELNKGVYVKHQVYGRCLLNVISPCLSPLIPTPIFQLWF